MSSSRLDAADSQSSRVFVGNVAPNTDEDALSEHFKKHGNVIGVVILKGFAFVQFETEAEAQRAIQAENGVEFNGRKIDVKVARRKPQDEKKEEQDHQQQQQHQQQQRGSQQDPDGPRQQQFPDNYGVNDQWNSGGRGRGGRGGYRGRNAPYNNRRDHGDYGGDDGYQHNDRWGGGRHGGGNYGGGGDYGGGYGGRGGHREDVGRGGVGSGIGVGSGDPKNDCEIVCVNKQQRFYAEMIEGRLKNLGLRVDVLFPNPEIPLLKILDNISSRGVLYAIVVAPVNEQHHSLTLNVLQGQQQEHRNMPLDEAMSFIAKNFEGILEGKVGGPADNLLPDDIRNVLGFLADNRPLSVMEYDKLIRYLSMKREAMLKLEYGENIPPSLANPPIGPPVDPAFKAKQDELHERIIQILNKPAPIKEAPKPQAAPVALAPELNASLQRAIDSLIKTGPNLLSQMNKGPSSTTGSQNSQPGNSGGGGGSGYNYSSYGRDSF